MPRQLRYFSERGGDVEQRIGEDCRFDRLTELVRGRGGEGPGECQCAPVEFDSQLLVHLAQRRLCGTLPLYLVVFPIYPIAGDLSRRRQVQAMAEVPVAFVEVDRIQKPSDQDEHQYKRHEGELRGRDPGDAVLQRVGWRTRGQSMQVGRVQCSAREGGVVGEQASQDRDHGEADEAHHV